MTAPRYSPEHQTTDISRDDALQLQVFNSPTTLEEEVTGLESGTALGHTRLTSPLGAEAAPRLPAEA